MAGYVEAAGAQDAFAVTKSDATVIRAEALYVGTGGTVVVTTRKGNEATFTNVPSGSVLPIACTQVKAATTASGIVGLIY